MKKVDLEFPEFLFIVATRAALGAGAALFGIGVVTTVPALMFLFDRDRATVPPAAEDRETVTAS